MKLLKSVTLLENYKQLHFSPIPHAFRETLVAMASREGRYANITDMKKSLRWWFWWQISRYDRDEITAASLPKSEWVGGYPACTDEHLDTLLKKVFSTVELTKMMVSIGITKF